MASLNPMEQRPEDMDQDLVRLAPLAQPETSDSAMETSSVSASTNSKEERTNSDSPSQKVEFYPATEPVSEESCLTSVTLAQDTASVSSDKGLLTEDDSDPPAVFKQDEPKLATKELRLDPKSGPSGVGYQTQPSTKERGLVESAPSTSKDGTASTGSEGLATAGTSLRSLVKRRSPSPSSSQEFLSAGSKTPDPEADENRLIPADAQPHDEEPCDQPRPTFRCGGLRNCIVQFLRAWQAWSIYVTDSIFLVPAQVTLIALSILAIVVGYVYKKDCPEVPEVPLLVLSLGYVGLLLICLRIAFVIYDFRSESRRYVGALRTLIIIVYNTFLILFASELYSFFTINPTLKSDLGDNCNAVFYTFTYVVNCVVSSLIFVIASMHVPAFIFYSFGIGGPGLPSMS